MLRTAAAVAALLLFAPQDKKLPVPDPAAQRDSEKMIRGIFKDEYAKKTPADRIALAKKLLQQGLDTADNDAAAYVLLREAADLSALSGETVVALQAISELGRRYKINAIELKAAALATAGKSMKLIDDFAELAKSYLSLVEEALAADDFDAAERAASAGSQFAKKGKNVSLLSKLDARAKEAGDRRSRAAKVTRAMEAIEKNPEDGEARFLVGHYLAVVKGDWDEGLGHLARGSDLAYKTAADKDLSQPSEPVEQVAVGDAWWDLGEKAEGAAKGRLRSRAGLWYLKSRDQVAGITRTKIDKRLDAAGLLPPVRPSIDLLRLIDVQQDTVHGRWEMQDGKLISPKVQMARVQIPYTPPEEYDLTVVLELDENQGSVNIGLVAGGSRVLAVIDGWSPERSVLGSIEDLADGEAVYKGRVLVAGRPNTIVCSVRKARLSVKVNGKLILDWPADYSRCHLEPYWATPNPRALVLAEFNSCFRFTKISLVPVTGDGQRLR
ncbi:MAG: hypothetical protein HY293_06860 [Planctomycetes bacterium]|nr:hypothetical protein [Planctomycetota bacterium]